MSWLSTFDNQTLLACQLFLAAAFSIAFLGIRQSHPDQKGIGSIAYGFLLGIPGIVLILAQGSVTPLISVVFANLLLCGTMLFFSHGILALIGSKRLLLPFWISSAASIAFLFYFSEIHDAIVPRLIVISFNIAFIHSLMGVEILRHSTARPILRLFGYSKFFFASVTLSWGLFALIHGVPSDVLQLHHVQTFTLVFTILASCVTGLFTLFICHEQALNRIRAESQLDPLTGVLNRRGIELKLDIELKRLERATQPLSIAIIDIDHFKTINDTAGHAAGDNAIRDVVSAIAARLRAYDLLGRFGGDEFLLILPQTSHFGAQVVAERIGEAVRKFSATPSAPSLTVSIGLTEAVHGDYSTSLLARADKALYKAKNAGRNCARTVLFDDNITTVTGTPQPAEAPIPSTAANLIQS
jgi:diguanylate cyclase (GGDEF)-like protein